VDDLGSAGSGPEKSIYLERLRKTSICMARGLSAICLLIIFVVVAYDVLVVQLFSDRTWRTAAQYFGSRDMLSLINKPWIVSTVCVLI